MQINPIEKHKSQIQKRIQQLQQKFKEKHDSKEPARRLRQCIADQNRNQGDIIINSKTVDMRPKNKVGAGQITRTKRQSYQPIIKYEPLMDKQYQNAPLPEQKNNEIKQLYDMMKSILEGQKNIEKEISEIKRQNLRNSVHKTKTNDQSSFMNQKISPIIGNSIEKDLHQLNNTDVLVGRNYNKINQSLLQDQKPVVKERAISKKRGGEINKNKNKQFDGLFQNMKEQNLQNQRFCIGEELKAKIWIEVEGRVRDSDQQYKDTIHRNNKHQFQHLMSTFDLQRKLKDDLKDKIFQQCNNLIYK